jgi:thiamine-monophosphate kinase
MKLREQDAVAIIRAAAAVLGVGTELVDDDTGAVPIDAAVVSSDVAVEGVDFASDLYPLRHAGARAMVQNLSDVRSAGAHGCGWLWSLCLPNHIGAGELRALSEGVMSVAALEGMPLVGGDLSHTDGPLIISITVFGRLVGRSDRVHRIGAQVGDRLFITAPLGGSAAGLRVLMNGRHRDRADDLSFDRWLAERSVVERSAVAAHLLSSLPSPMCLQHATAAIDISDGFARDAHRLARASAVGLHLDGDVIDRASAANTQDAWFGGEDHQLLFSQPPHAPVPAGMVPVGEVVDAHLGVRWQGLPMPDRGYDHGQLHDDPGLPTSKS